MAALLEFFNLSGFSFSIAWVIAGISCAGQENEEIPPNCSEGRVHFQNLTKDDLLKNGCTQYGFCIRDWNIRELIKSEGEEPHRSLLFCYESDIMCQQQPEEAEGKKNNGSGQMGSKFGRRFFSPRPNKGRLECSRGGKRNGGSHEADGKALNAIFVELRWSNKMYLDANFLDSPVEITQIIMKEFSGNIVEFVDFWLSHNEENGVIRKPFKHKVIEEQTKTGAFLVDYPFGALNLFLSCQKMSFLHSCERQKIFYKLCEPSADLLSKQTRESLLKGCAAEIAEWNKGAGYQKYELNDDAKKDCLETEKERSLYFGENGTNPIPPGQNQTWGGRSSTGPVEPIPPQNRTGDWNSRYTQTFNIDELPPHLRPSHLRSKRDDGSKKNVECICEEFDLRKNPFCGKVIGRIRDQGKCGSCWAVSTASALTDRVCMAAQKHNATSKYKTNESDMDKPYMEPEFERFASARDTMECTSTHALGKLSCDSAGSSFAAWEYYSREGTVNERCKPYIRNEPLVADARGDWCERCHHSCDKKTSGYGSLDLLKWSNRGRSFDRNSYHKEMGENDWKIVKLFAGNLYSVNAYKMVNGTEFSELVMNEIKENGTVVAIYNVYPDFKPFPHDKKLPYAHKPGLKTKTKHAVRVIGYGSMHCGEEKSDYWLIANSWSANWGDKGIFRIVRGKDESGIESKMHWGSIFFPF